jgi:hypothetical protein
MGPWEKETERLMDAMERDSGRGISCRLRRMRRLKDVAVVAESEVLLASPDC